MEQWVQIVVTVICSVIASSGFWAYVMKKSSKNDITEEFAGQIKQINLMKDMLIGLGHDRIVTLGEFYIKRGYITSDEYENLNDYLYEPYDGIGGNGSASRIMKRVKNLPFKEENDAKQIND